jgi:muconate cycloisomerase
MTGPAPKIVAVEPLPVAVSGTCDFAISEGRTRVHTSVILRLRTEDDGLAGIAEIVCAPPGKPEELPDEIVGAVRTVVAPALIGLAATDRRLGCARVEAALKGRPWTKAAVNVALHDLQARTLGVSVRDLLGGRLNDRIPVIGTVIGLMAPDAMARQAAETAAAGYRAIKIKIGEAVAFDVARVAAVREAIGHEVALRVDANDHYQPADAVRLIRAIERYDIEHVEQPISRRDLLGMADVRKSVGIPLMTDDMVATPEEAMTVIRLGAADRVKVKVTKHGLDGARQIVDMLAAAGMKAVLGHVFEMGLAAVAEAHLAATVPNLAGPHEIGSMRPMGTEADVIAEDLRAEPGFLRIPEGPGLGVQLDWDRIEALRADAVD